MAEAPNPQPDAGAHDTSPAARARAVLEGMGAPAALAEPLVAALGPGADAELAADPWRLLALPGITPEQADFCARRALGEAAAPDDPRRGRAVVAHLLRRAVREGHTAVEERRLAEAVRSMGVRSPGPALTAALDDGEVMVFEAFEEPDDVLGDDGEPAEMPDPDRYYAPAHIGLAEQDLGEGVVRLTATAEPIMDPATAAETVDAVADRLGAEIAPETAAAVAAAALRGVCVLTHGAGAEQAVAHVLACLDAVAADSETGIAVAAPTAQAAAAINAALEGLAGVAARAVPLPRLLECRAPGVYGRGAENPIDAGLVVVAGAMAVDVERAAALVEACADGTHLVLLADPAQAPSAGPGRVAADLAESGTVAVAALPDGPEPGPVARLAGLVAGGELGRVEAPDREVVVVPAASAAEAAHRVVQVVADSIPRAVGVPADQVQVVAATRGGEAGVDALNAACKARLNPGSGALGGFDPGDRVLFAADGPGYAAGDVGVLRAGESGPVVDLADGSAAEVADPAVLRPGWAVTVAAAHGGAWPAVVAVFPPETRGSRPQVYTAVGTARRHLTIVHAAGPALARAVRESPAITRHTRLIPVLREG
ncbi:helix-hairpin-helix domain-containing protein [Nocardiopsis trehalosi]|jgi:exodeoxyribonuclease V alpha subunit|uniref:helix-hairpin-helix domain-containing protein n=1 Tax=Nocardiopsis trehalosi TaxID=109329 RepID=UPI000A07B904|nr:helix-hairpin-helix domain-containing protein [Nocardiopsis trehalosi]